MFERFTERARQVVVLAQDEARALKHNYIGTEHILLGLVRENEGVAARILLDFDADAEKIRNEIISMLSGPGRTLQKRGAGSDSLRWEYDVKTLEGSSDTWAHQLTNWRQDGWELLAVVTEGNERRAVERRI
jgi:ATP-dependent Clp protease ATP-binding subunit ClpA